MSVTNSSQISCEWKHANPVHIMTGIDLIDNFKQLVPHHEILYITTEGSTQRGTTEKVLNIIGKDHVIIHDQVNSYPEIDDLDLVTNQFKHSPIKCILALGGGSVVDTAKVLSVTLPSKLENPLDATLRRNCLPTWHTRIPVVAVPTTSGTGAEVTPFATVWDSSTSKKHSLFNELLYPAYALLDPSLTLTLPHKETLYTGLDAISHALESLWNKNCTPISELFSIQSLRYSVGSLFQTLKDPDNLFYRRRMQMSSLYAGLSISQTKTAIAHSISYPLTSYYAVPHGLACSFTLKSIAETLLDEQLPEYAWVISSVISLLEELDLVSEIKKYINYDDGLKLVPLMINPDRAGNFIRSIDEDELISILKASFGNT